MSEWYLAADLHLGHKNVTRLRPQFSSVAEHDNYVKAKIEATITKRDVLCLLGDIAFTYDGLLWIKSLPCKTILVVGNHDTENDITMKDLAEAYDEVYSSLTKKDCLLTHQPVHPLHIRKKFNIHGHLHSHLITDPRYFNVSIEHTNYGLIPFNQVLAQLENSNKEL